eukprot:3480479-Amphidinium_carterae.1
MAVALESLRSSTHNFKVVAVPSVDSDQATACDRHGAALERFQAAFGTSLAGIRCVVDWRGVGVVNQRHHRAAFWRSIANDSNRTWW